MSTPGVPIQTESGADRMGHVGVDRAPAGSATRISLLSIIILGLGASLYVANVYQSRLDQWDDGYITFRYAQHLAHGQGLTWNIGGERSEGFTSLLHVAVLSLGIKAGIRPELGSVLLSVACVFATLALILKILKREVGAVHPLAALLVSVYLVDDITAVHSTSGLETQLFVLLLCAAYFVALRFVDSPSQLNATALALLVFASVLGRPEGVLFGAAVYGVLFLSTLRRGPGNGWEVRRITRLGTSAGLLVILGIAYAVTKYEYFGYLLPNPYYVKSSQISLQGLGQVLSYLKHLIIFYGPLTVGFLFLLPQETFLACLQEPQKRAKVLLTLAPPSVALAYYTTTIHEMGMAHRFSYPTNFYIVLAGAICISLAMRSFDTHRFHLASLRWPLLGLVCIGILVCLWRGWTVTSPSDIAEYHLKIAAALRETGLGPRATVLIDAAGVIPYISGFNHVDRVGLTDNFLSGRTRSTPREREEYIWGRRPDVYVGYEPPAQVGSNSPSDDGQMKTAYVQHSLLGRTQTVITERISPQDPDVLYFRMKTLRDEWYWLGEVQWPGWRLWREKSFIYVRKDSPYFDVLVSSLQKIITVESKKVDLNVATPSTD
jgi:hypothetical protein